ncbi:hypothetical protein BURKHO8Y_70065 [Burkholderia sp. 8Y]|nr:hypothetical protein BURKHO8Y_70065 [Burkholderia sp. 8Y]
MSRSSCSIRSVRRRPQRRLGSTPGTTPLNMIADNALRRFKSLVETGEIPTLERQPAARETKR